MESTKAKIFNAAVKIFSEKGFDGATMDEIARNADVAKGTLYYHFKSKEDIFNFLAEEGMSFIKNHIVENTGDISDPAEKLRHIIAVQMDLIYKYNDFFKLMLAQIWKDNNREEQLRKWLYEYIDVLGAVISEGEEKGAFKEGTPKFKATALFGLISSIYLFRFMTDDSHSKEEMTNLITDYILNGIKK